MDFEVEWQMLHGDKVAIKVRVTPMVAGYAVRAVSVVSELTGQAYLMPNPEIEDALEQGLGNLILESVRDFYGE